jgi:predicted DNA-binding protein (MmcQ/YjbR family)
MPLDELRAYLLAKPATTEEEPFGPGALVYKVKGKMYALVAWQETPLSVNLKCNSMRALALREQYAAVTPGYHMNKQHWNTVLLDGSIPQDEFEALIDHSYELVVKGLPKAQRDKLAGAI